MYVFGLEGCDLWMMCYSNLYQSYQNLQQS